MPTNDNVAMIFLFLHKQGRLLFTLEIKDGERLARPITLMSQSVCAHLLWEVWVLFSVKVKQLLGFDLITTEREFSSVGVWAVWSAKRKELNVGQQRLKLCRKILIGLTFNPAERKCFCTFSFVFLHTTGQKQWANTIKTNTHLMFHKSLMLPSSGSNVQQQIN